MANTTVKNSKRRPAFKQNTQGDEYTPFGQTLTVDDKLKVLEQLGQTELVDLFKDWKPRRPRKRKGAPLDQRMAITVTNMEKLSLDNEMKSLKASGEKITASQFIRNRAMASVDINGWAEIAKTALKELEELEAKSPELRSRRRELLGLIEEAEDPEDQGMYELELQRLSQNLDKLVAKNEKRTNRLTGRMSMTEAETVKWRAARLCISASDYLRLMIFSLEPNSAADAHMSLSAKRRFYVSIIEVSQNGWGTPPNTYECKNCINYLEEIDRLRDRVKQLETFM